MIFYITCFCSLILTGFKRALLDSDLWALEEGSLSHSIVPRLQSEWEKEIRKCHGSVNNVCKNDFYYYNFYYKIIIIIIFTITAIGIQTLCLIV